MALKANKNGEYKVKNAAQAAEALVLMKAQQTEIEEIFEEMGIAEMQKECDALKKAATAWAVANEVERIDFQPGFHATLVKQSYGAQFIATEDEMPDELPDNREIVPLKVVIEKKFKGSIKEKGKARRVWNRVTKRVVDRAAVDQAVADGILTVDELAQCFVEKEKAPYLRIFED